MGEARGRAGLIRGNKDLKSCRAAIPKFCILRLCSGHVLTFDIWFVLEILAILQGA